MIDNTIKIGNKEWQTYVKAALYKLSGNHEIIIKTIIKQIDKADKVAEELKKYGLREYEKRERIIDTPGKGEIIQIKLTTKLF